jgi:hypothetical protein
MTVVRPIRFRRTTVSLPATQGTEIRVSVIGLTAGAGDEFL